MIVFEENSKKSINKLLELIKKFSIVFVYKVNIQNIYFYILAAKKKIENEILKSNSIFKKAPKIQNI